jgi:trk system potassium uptake protein TrkA
MRFVIVGCGRVGAQLANQLFLQGHEVTIIDRDPAAFRRLSPAYKGHKVEGVGFDRDVLVSAGIERADGFASVTNGDNANLVSAQIARRVFRVPRVVARIYDPRRAGIYRRLGLLTISPTEWGASRISQVLCHPGMSVLQSMGNGEVHLVEVEVTAHLAGHRVNELVIPGEMNVVALMRGGRATVPTLGTAMQIGDTVQVSVQATAMGRLAEMLHLA